jgi:hypothetical protein
MIGSLNAFITAHHIDAVIFIDGGTDSLAFRGSSVVSPTEDTMSLAAIGLGCYDPPLKYRIVGVSAVGSDGEMSLDEISRQLLKIYRAGGYIGGTFFPAERLYEYAALVSKVLQVYPTATALSPLQVTNIPFKTNPKYHYPALINGFQLATFLFDASIAVSVANDFCRLIFEQPSRKSAKAVLREALSKKSAEGV